MPDRRPSPPWQAGQEQAPTVSGPPPVPTHLLDITALTDDRDNPTTALQYGVLDRGEHHVYGDQSWVAYGNAQREEHPDGKTQRRRVTIAYGPWVDVDATRGGPAVTQPDPPPVDLRQITQTWLNQCGPCDYGMVEYGCTHPDGDYRPVMMSLVREVERLRADAEAHSRLFEQRDEAITERDRLRERLIAEREAHAAHCRDEERTYGELTREFELAAAERDRMRPVVEAARDVVEVIRPNVGTLFGSARAAGERFIAAVDALDAVPGEQVRDG